MAAQHFERAANLGHSLAAYNLAVCGSMDVPGLAKAAELGNKHAMYALAVVYGSGDAALGGPQRDADAAAHVPIFNNFSAHADGERRGAGSDRRAASERPRRDASSGAFGSTRVLGVRRWHAP